MELLSNPLLTLVEIECVTRDFITFKVPYQLMLLNYGILLFTFTSISYFNKKI